MTTDIPSEVLWRGLARTIEILSKPEAWLQDPEHRARDKKGKPCKPLDMSAVKWRLDGALLRARAEVQADFRFAHFAPIVVAAAIGESFDPDELYTWNNAPERTHRDVIAALKSAFDIHATIAHRMAHEHLQNVRAGALKFVDDTAFPEAMAHADRIWLVRRRVEEIVGVLL